MRRVLAGMLVAAGVAACTILLLASGNTSRPTDLGQEDSRLRAGVKEQLFEYPQQPAGQYQYAPPQGYQYPQQPQAYQRNFSPQQQALTQVPPPAAAAPQQQEQQSFLQNAGSYYAQAAGGQARGWCLQHSSLSCKAFT